MSSTRSASQSWSSGGKTCAAQINFGAEGLLITTGERLEDLPGSSGEKHNRASAALLALP